MPHRTSPATASAPISNATIEEIVERNIRSGRLTRVNRVSGRNLTHAEYTAIVASHYLVQCDRVMRLQNNEQATWEELWQQLFRIAYGLLVRGGWDNQDAAIRAEEAVQETCLSVYCRSYPYDCPFDAWVFTILRHHVFRAYHRSRNPLDMLDRVSTLDEDSEEETPDVSSSIVDLNALVAALEALASGPQREVILDLFFRDLSVAETAARLGKSPQAIYDLKRRALTELAKTLNQTPSLGQPLD
jgi:RNA polymerase sigma-70 factor, ECF subfamily